MSIQNTLRGKMYFMGSSFSIRFFGGVKCHFLNIEVKSTNGWIV